MNRQRRTTCATLALALVLAGCSDDAVRSGSSSTAGTEPTASISPAESATGAASVVPTSTTAPTTSTTITPTTTSTSTTSTSTTSTTSTTTTEPPPTSTPYQIPLAEPAGSGWGTTHSGYSATDIFAPCDAAVVSPVNGQLLEVRTVNAWDPAADNPATRGGRSISILGDDGVRYYMAHFETIEPALAPGDRVAIGQGLATVGQTGRASACHIHFAISPPCPGKEWSVRRGVVWPYPYLDSWRAGGQASPVDEVTQWLAANPGACADAMADPYAGDS